MVGVRGGGGRVETVAADASTPGLDHVPEHPPLGGAQDRGLEGLSSSDGEGRPFGAEVHGDLALAPHRDGAAGLEPRLGDARDPNVVLPGGGGSRVFGQHQVTEAAQGREGTPLGFLHAPLEVGGGLSRGIGHHVGTSGGGKGHGLGPEVQGATFGRCQLGAFRVQDLDGQMHGSAGVPPLGEHHVHQPWRFWGDEEPLLIHPTRTGLPVQVGRSTAFQLRR